MEGTTISFRQQGSGALAIFLHGFGPDSRMWLNQLQGLDDQRWCVAPDLRAHGQSAPAVDPVHSPELLADDIAEMIVGLGAHVADLVGFSMGGYVALALLERHPALVRSVVLADTKATADSEEARKGRDAGIATLLEGGRTAFAGGLISKFVAADADAQVVGAVRTMIESTPYETLVADLRGMRDRPDRTHVLEALRVPCLAIVGEHDVLTPPSDAAWIAQHAQGTTVVEISGAGHMSPMEQPAAVSDAIRAFWEAG